MYFNAFCYSQATTIRYVSRGGIRPTDEAVLGVREGAQAELYADPEGSGWTYLGDGGGSINNVLNKWSSDGVRCNADEG